MLYNDHELGTPPSSWFGLPNLETRREVSSFLAGMDASSIRRTTGWRCAIIPVSAPSVKFGGRCGSLLSLYRPSSNMAVQPGTVTGFGDPAILFGRDRPYFNQRKWPITLCTVQT
jgi:hypothetical protein